jgi:hypothetical protein
VIPFFAVVTSVNVGHYLLVVDPENLQFRQSTSEFLRILSVADQFALKKLTGF